MTVDDLIAVFEKARAEAAPFPQHHEDGLYAGIAAVVRALRDAIVEDGNCKYCVATTAMYNEILGDAGEKVAGGSTREDEQSCNSSDGSSPATDAAPAVCVWTQKGWEYRTAGCNGWSAHIYSPKYSPPGNKCPHCKAPIKLTEAK